MSARRLQRAYWLWLAVLLWGYYAFPEHKLILWSAIGLTSAAAVFYGAVRYRPRRRLPWFLVSAALLVFTAGDFIYLVLTEVLGEVNPFPSAADVLYLAMYPLLVAGLLMLPSSATGRDRAGVIDSLVVAAGVGVLSWIFLITPYLENHSLSTLEQLTSIAYPLSDIVFLAAAAWFVAAVPKTPTVLLMAAGGVALLVTDVLYGLSQLEGTWSMGGPVDFGWIVFYATWGAAALHPSMAGLTEPRVVQDSQITGVRLGVLTASALVAPAILLVEELRGVDIDGVPIALMSALIFLLVLLRLAGVVRSHRQATERERSLREAGAALVSATDVETVRGVVATAVDRLFQGVDDHEAGLILNGDRMDAGVRRAALLRGEPATHFQRTGELGRRFQPYDYALVSPLVVHEPISGDPVVGTLVVAADDQQLATRRGAVEVLAAEAALAVERIALNREIARRDSEEYFRTLVQSTADVIVIVDDDNTIRYVSPSATTMFGDRRLVGLPFQDLPIPEEHERANTAMALIRAGVDRPSTGRWTTRNADGDTLLVEVTFRDLRQEPTVRGIVFTLRDVTEQLRLERELTDLAYHDPLTGLANRVLFSDQVRRAVALPHGSGGIVGVLFVDVDDFKVVNDAMGHDTGDQLLIAVAQRLTAVLRPSDTAARLGGDEFAVLIEDASPSYVEHVADRIVRTLAEPVVLGASLVSASASIGVATTLDASASGDLLRQADLALYVAKGAGKGRWRRYQSDLHTAVVERLALRSALEHALAAGDFSLRYQPIVSLADAATVGFEALLRWEDPIRGTVGPTAFIDVAEDSGLIVPIGAWAMTKAIDDATSWSGVDGRHRAPYLSINVSVRQFRTPGLIDTIRRELERTGLPPDRLLLEITESLLLRDDERVWHDLTALRDIGIRVAIDDFGTGYSSLSYLRQVPIDVVKIDKSFIDSMESSPQQRALVEGIVRLAHTLGLEVVAEGIERPGDRDLLVSMGCPYGQGFLYSPPMAADAARRRLRAEQAATARA